jgi:hypothetical protein
VAGWNEYLLRFTNFTPISGEEQGAKKTGTMGKVREPGIQDQSFSPVLIASNLNSRASHLSSFVFSPAPYTQHPAPCLFHPCIFFSKKRTARMKLMMAEASNMPR